MDPHLLSHPLPRERISQLERLAKQSPHFGAKDPPALQARHDLMRAKLFGFVERSDTVLRRYPPSNTSAPARYARAVLAYKSGRLSEALATIEGLLAEQPGNAFFHELKGQALLESGRAREAVPSLRHAVALVPNGAPIRAMLGHALLASGDVNAAIPELKNATTREPDSRRPSAISPWRTGAAATSARRNSPPPKVSSMPATKNAQTQASRAMTKLPPGSAGYLKAEDILNYRPSKND